MVNEPKLEIPEWLSKRLTLAGVGRLEKVVCEAEKNTVGEIVPVIVRRSFEFSPPSQTVTLILVLLYFLFAEFWMTSIDDLTMDLLFLAGLIMVILVSRLLAKSPLTRVLLSSPQDLTRMAEARAEIEFTRVGTGKTRGRTGILLFLAVEDRRAVVLGDAAIASKISGDRWQQVMELMIGGIRQENLEKGFADAILACGRILAEHFPVTEQHNPDELANRLIIKG
jgi:putative membrane protein